MTLKGNNDFVEVDTAVPQNTCTIEHNVHDNESMISSNIKLSKQKRVNAAKDSSYAVLSMESEEDYFEDEMPIDEDGKEGSPLVQFWREQCGLFFPMSGWFLFSALLSSYNKYVFGKDHMNFPCPLLLTSIHFTLQWVFSASLTNLYPKTLGGDQIKNMSHKQFWGISIPCGGVTSSDIGLSNLAVARISLSFYTMVKASSPIFVVASAYLFGIERITWTLIIVVLIISCGEYLTVLGEIDFDLLGFLLCLGASICSGIRWTLVQLKLKSINPPLKSPIATMRVLAPVMLFGMISLSMMLEKPWISLPQYFTVKDPSDSGSRVLTDGNFSSSEPTIIGLNCTTVGNSSTPEYSGSSGQNCPSHGTPLEVIFLGLVGAVLAICMILCEFYLIMNSNAIILMIGGVLKEILTIFVGVIVFQDHINPINMLGCLIVFSGVVLYKITLHLSKMEAKAIVESDGTQTNALVNQDNSTQNVEESIEDAKMIEDNLHSTLFVIDDDVEDNCKLDSGNTSS